MDLLEKESVFELYCPKCAERVETESDNCPKCGFKIIEYEDKPKSPNSTVSNGVASTMRTLGIIIIFCGFVAGIVIGRDRWGDFSFTAAIIWWAGGFISGMFTYAIGEIVWFLHAIYNRLGEK